MLIEIEIEFACFDTHDESKALCLKALSMTSCLLMGFSFVFVTCIVACGLAESHKTRIVYDPCTVYWLYHWPGVLNALINIKIVAIIANNSKIKLLYVGSSI